MSAILFTLLRQTRRLMGLTHYLMELIFSVERNLRILIPSPPRPGVFRFLSSSTKESISASLIRLNDKIWKEFFAIYRGPYFCFKIEHLYKSGKPLGLMSLIIVALLKNVSNALPCRVYILENSYNLNLPFLVKVGEMT